MTNVRAIRSGDFYEFYDDDAVIVGKNLNLTVTKARDSHRRMCGIPEHAWKAMLGSLLSCGVRVVYNSCTQLNCGKMADPGELLCPHHIIMEKDAAAAIERRNERLANGRAKRKLMRDALALSPLAGVNPNAKEY